MAHPNKTFLPLVDAVARVAQKDPAVYLEILSGVGVVCVPGCVPKCMHIVKDLQLGHTSLLIPHRCVSRIALLLSGQLPT